MNQQFFLKGHLTNNRNFEEKKGEWGKGMGYRSGLEMEKSQKGGKYELKRRKFC